MCNTYYMYIGGLVICNCLWYSYTYMYVCTYMLVWPLWWYPSGPLPQVSLTRANMFAEQGRFKKALFNCSKAIQLHPNSARAHMCR